ncbi:expansin EXLX1 family cellulose-binding protein [Microbispora sp. ATCC PTA-5024]|uniref:expansin EXLX1 family cellulose-binding protein n=1 Tax=Microbispora sp. ATCC PTA-5024 TaxID=316330 RepID=UPI0003DD134B|nr:expansin EXLX1 family cellulose-binding protein [Microbispora sp. ATCC PTA-5024]ETK36025.1 rare lipoprotein A [Microbispora sp. ATCC PTA-5024]
MPPAPSLSPRPRALATDRAPAARSALAAVFVLAALSVISLFSSLVPAVPADASASTEAAPPATGTAVTTPRTAAAAALPDLRRTTRGTATFYELRSGGGNCSYPAPPAGGLYVALSPAEYAKGARCGGYLTVAGPKGTVRVKIVDQCPPCRTGQLDLSRAAFARIADPARGAAAVRYRLAADPRPSGRLAFRVKEGSSQWWLALLVMDHGNPLASVEVGQGGRWRPLVRTEYNYWVAQDPGAGPGPFTIRVTDVRGHRGTVRKVRLSVGALQRSRVRLY